MLTLTDCPHHAPRAAHETTEGQAVIVNLNSGTLFSLNATGTFLWERLDGRTSLAAIAAALATAYEVETSVTEPDVLELANTLLQEGLLVKG